MDVRVLNVDDVSITLVWLKPDPPQGIITHYNVRYNRSNQDEASMVDSDVKELTHRIMNLQTNVTYFVQVFIITTPLNFDENVF